VNDDFHDADELDNFIEQRRGNESISPTSPEAAFAADLIDLTSAIEPDTAFMAKLDERFSSGRFSANGHSQKERIMLVQKQPFHIPWTLTAALAAVLLSVTVLVGLSIWPSVPQSSLAGTTATPVPEQVTSLAISVGGYVSDFSETTFQKMRDAGITWIGADLSYAASSNANAPSLITTAQSLITSAHNNGFRIMLRVSGIASDMLDKSETYNEEFAQFVSYLATLQADAIQIWNQQNLDLFWRGDQLDPVAYIDLLHESYLAIKAANPVVMVIMGAPAPTGAQDTFPGQVVNDDVYYEGMAEAYIALGEPAADCIGMAYVEGIVAPDQATGDSRDDYPTRYFTTMLRRAYAPFQETRLPLCITELGYLSGEGLVDENATPQPPPFPPPFAWADKTTVEQQAEWVADAIKIVSEMSSIEVRMVMIWRINGMPLNPLMSGYAIIRPDGSCPACEAIAALRQ
jgi:hypothetical protein